MSDDDKYRELQEEYQEFAYFVSHDLNSPVRHIKEFLRLLFEEMDFEADSDSLKLKGFIDQSLTQIEDKLSSLLKFSRAATFELHLVKLKSKDVIEMILPKLSNKDIPIVFEGDFPQFPMDLQSFQEIFLHVLDNAVKFQTESQKAVNVVSKEEDNYYTFSVIDHGLGIPPDKNDYVFKLFKRLHTEIEGHGLGLTLSKKLIQRYSGDISLAANGEQGTVVTLRFPKT